jgi:hypothetical protein
MGEDATTSGITPSSADGLLPLERDGLTTWGSPRRPRPGPGIVANIAHIHLSFPNTHITSGEHRFGDPVNPHPVSIVRP